MVSDLSICARGWNRELCQIGEHGKRYDSINDLVIAFKYDFKITAAWACSQA